MLFTWHLRGSVKLNPEIGAVHKFYKVNYFVLSYMYTIWASDIPNYRLKTIIRIAIAYPCKIYVILRCVLYIYIYIPFKFWKLQLTCMGVTRTLFSNILYSLRVICLIKKS